MEKKHIAMFISSLDKGGSERVLVNLAEYFYGRGYAVTIVTQYRAEMNTGFLPESNGCIPRFRRDKSEKQGGKFSEAFLQAAQYMEDGAAGPDSVLYREE